MPARWLEKHLEANPPARGFAKALRKERIQAVAEFKRASPRAGLLSRDSLPETVALEYEAGGAAAISVLTDGRFFRGDPSFLPRVRAAVSLPVLRKDFLLEPYQVLEARFLGADAALFIAGTVSRRALRHLVRLSRRLGMDSVVEAHDERGLEDALEAEPEVIGINLRNLRTFRLEPEAAERLLPQIPRPFVRLAESGIARPDQVRMLSDLGADAVLVGEYLMRQKDRAAALRRLLSC